MTEQQKALKSLVEHPGWKLVVVRVMQMNSTQLNETEKQGVSSEDICKSIGGLLALRRLVGWVESSASQEDSVVQ